MTLVDVVTDGRVTFTLSQGKIGMARCHKDDTFDIWTGIGVALVKSIEIGGLFGGQNDQGYELYTERAKLRDRADGFRIMISGDVVVLVSLLASNVRLGMRELSSTESKRSLIYLSGKELGTILSEDAQVIGSELFSVKKVGQVVMEREGDDLEVSNLEQDLVKLLTKALVLLGIETITIPKDDTDIINKRIRTWTNPITKNTVIRITKRRE